MGVGGVSEGLLQQIADDARRDVEGCTAAGISLVGADGPAVVAATTLLARQLELAQWEAGEGPGLDAVRQLQVFNVASLASSRCWPAFARLAAARGVQSMLAVPITHRGRALGVLQLYGSAPDVFAGHERTGLHHAAVAALSLTTAAREDEGGDGAVAPGASRAVS